jgi:hypothetical protein
MPTLPENIMVSPSRISRAAVQALKKESFICEPMSAPGFVMLGAGTPKRPPCAKSSWP